MFPPRDQPAGDETVTLASWSGTPLESQNHRAWLEAGTIVGVVAAADSREVMLSVDETDVELLAPGQQVKLQLAAIGSQTLTGTIADIAQVGAEHRKLAPERGRWHGNGPLATTKYEARVTLDTYPNDLAIDTGGRAKVEVGSVRVGDWIVRELRDTFRLP